MPQSRVVLALLTFFTICATPWPASLHAQTQIDPAVRARLDREFAAAHPQPGDYLPSCELKVLTDKPDVYPQTIRFAAYGDAKLVVTASLTCPKTRQHFPAIQKLKEKYGEKLGVTIVYVIEAHPENDVCPYLGVVDLTEANIRDKIRYRQPSTIEGRLQLATAFAKMYPIEGTVLVDSMDNVAWRTLGQSPNAAVLASSDGRVTFRQGWIDPPALIPEIDKLIAQADADRQPNKALARGRDEPSPSMQEIMQRVNSENPNQWYVVDWLAKVDLPHLKALFAKYPKVINEPLVYGAHSHKVSSILDLMVARKAPELVKATIAAGADLNQELNETTPLSTAISVNSVLMVDQLITAGADVHKNPDSRTRSLMHVALMQGRVDVAKRLAQAGIAHDIFSRCGLGMLDAIKQELDANPSSGLRYDVAGNIPLSYAVACNQTAVVRLLLDRQMTAETGAPARGSPVELAAKLESAEIMSMLMRHGVPPGSGGGSAAFIALREGKLEQFNLLLDAKVDLTKTRQGQTLLHQASRFDLPIEFATALLEHGADLHTLTTGYSDDGCGPSDPKSSQETALHLAARTLKPKHVALFLTQGAKPDVKDQAGMTPLAAAIASTLQAEPKDIAAGLATVKALIAGGCAVNAMDSEGNIIRDSIAEIIKQPAPVTVAKAEENSPFLPEFVVEPTLYRGPTGLNVKLVPSTALLKEIHNLLTRPSAGGR